MASKRKTTKPGTPIKPVARPVVANASADAVTRRSVMVPTVDVAPAPSQTELRAEREPAVQVAMEDWAPAPHQMGWWERIQARLVRKREAKAEMASHMAAVKAGVLQELETMGVKKGVAVKGSPFASVLLPTTPKKSPKKWWLLAAAVVILVMIMVWVGRGPQAPEAVLGQAVAAVRANDLRTFETKVDVASVATSVVNQMFNVPQPGSLAARMTAFAKPGLAVGLKDEILAAVGGEKLDDSGNTLLGKLWHALGGEYLRVGNARVAMQDERMVVSEVPLLRTDLNLTLPLQVVMTRSNDGDDWQVSDVPNLAAVLDSMGEAERIMAERRARAAEAAASAGADVRVESVKKAKDTTIEGSSNVIVSMVLANIGSKAAKDVQLDVAFGDAAGQPMMTTRLTLDGEIAAGARKEQVWSVPIDRARAVERYVADLPLSALTVTVTVAK